MTKDEVAEKQRAEIDEVIDRLNLTVKTSLDRKQIHERIRKAMVTSNLALVLADVVNTLLMDTESLLRPFGAVFQRDEKRAYNQVVKYIHDAIKATDRICNDVYHSEESDLYAEDCDWWYNIVRLIQDRTGDDVQKTRLLLQFVVTMPSVMGMFDVKYKDFKRTVV